MCQNISATKSDKITKSSPTGIMVLISCWVSNAKSNFPNNYIVLYKGRITIHKNEIKLQENSFDIEQLNFTIELILQNESFVLSSFNDPIPCNESFHCFSFSPTHAYIHKRLSHSKAEKPKDNLKQRYQE